MITEFRWHLAALYSNPDKFLSDTFLVIAIGIVVVFLALIALTVIFWLFGRLMNRQDKRPIDSNASQEELIPVVPPLPVKSVARPDADEEIIAVITAAVAAMSLTDKKSYTVRSLRRLHNRPVWASVGISESTRPF